MSTIDLRFTTLSTPLPDFIFEGLKSYAIHSNQYHHQSDELRTMLASKHSVSNDMIYLTAGIDQIILALCALHGENVHIFTPTYISYVDAKVMGGSVTEHPSLKDSKYIIESDHIPSATLIFLANPNNPAGFVDHEIVEKLIANNPDAIVAIDEAYSDFMRESVTGLVDKHPNLIVMRSFSKGYSLAGFRIGYTIAQPETLASLNKLESLWFNVADTSVGAAITALNHEDYFSGLRAEIIKQRQLTEECLFRSGIKFIKGQINAVLIKFDNKKLATEFANKLKSNGILVNQGNGASNVGLDDSFIRISIGTTDMMEKLRKTIRSY